MRILVVIVLVVLSWPKTVQSGAALCAATLRAPPQSDAFYELRYDRRVSSSALLVQARRALRQRLNRSHQALIFCQKSPERQHGIFVLVEFTNQLSGSRKWVLGFGTEARVATSDALNQAHVRDPSWSPMDGYRVVKKGNY